MPLNTICNSERFGASVGTQDPVSHGRIFFFLLGFLLASEAPAQSPDSVDARAAGSVLEVRQGNVLATAVLVRNPSAVRKTYNVRVALPDGWKPILRDTRFELAPGQSDTRLLSFSLPASASAGTYRVRYLITDQDAPARETEVAIEVRIIPVLKLELKLLEAPRFVAAGQRYTVRFALTNLGNMAGRVRLSARNVDDFAVQIDSPRVFLEPKQTRTITAVVMTVRDNRGKLANALEMTAQLGADSTVRARAASVVDVIPQTSDVDDRYLELPLRVSGRIAGEEGRVGGQIEVMGGGSLTEDRSDRLDLLVRTPDIQSQSSLGLRDEYRLRYAATFGEFQVGDWNYSLSPLTEYSRYAFGGMGMIHFKGIKAGGYFNESRFLTPNQRQLAGFLGFEVEEKYGVTANFLKKDEQVESEITSVRGIVRPLSLANLDIEYGVSSGEKGRDNAFAAQLSGKEKILAYDARFVRAGSSYTGYYRDVNYRSFALNLFPMHEVRLEAYYREEDRNLKRDTSLFFAPREQFIQLGGGYSNLIALYFRSTVQEDRLPIPQYQRREEMAQIRLGYSVGQVALFSNIDLGSTHNKLTGKSFPFQRYALFSSFSIAAAQNYSTSLEYSTERDLFTGDPLDRIGASVTASLFLTPKSNLLATAYWTRSFTSVRQDYALFDVALQHVFPFRHQVSIRARQNYAVPAVNGRELAYMLQYSVPVGIPIKRMTSNGQLRGKILDEQGRGVRNVLINVGTSAALTDSDGEFFFPSLSPGENFLVLDKLTIGMNRVPDVLTPLPVNIAGGKEAELNVHLVQSSVVTGLVTLSAFDKNDTSMTALIEVGPQAGLVLELSNGTEIQRRVSDNRGRFVFSDLRPGRWTVRVAGGVLPQYHFVDRESHSVDLAAGGKREVAFRILPRRRTIRIIETGVVQPQQVRADTAAQRPVEPETIRQQQVPPKAAERVEPMPGLQQRARGDTSVKRPAIQPEQARPAEIVTHDICLVSYDRELKGYVVQISSWMTLTKATARATYAERMTGLKAKISQAEVRGLGTRYRVKVGPFRTKAEANSFCGQLLEMEREAVAAEATEQEICLVSFDAKLRGYMLQISSWETLLKATTQAKHAEQTTGLKSRIDRADVRGLGTRYRVKIGPFRTKADAESSCQKLIYRIEHR